jgi:NAD(P)-dependent dehydrogenase (short-subunit alcohol dehydrogenase family)
MVPAGGGAIINLGSWVARLGLPVGALYSSTKGAVETLSRAWAAEFGSLGIRVNAISPGVILPPDCDPDTEYPGAVFMRGARRARPVTQVRSPPRRSISPQTRPPSSTARSSTSTGAG